MDPRERLILALDFDSLETATPYVETLAPYVGYFKVGLELSSAAGTPQAVRFVHARGGKVMLDHKFKDIPNTMAGAARAAAKLGVSMFTVLAGAGIEGMRAAVEGAGSFGVRPSVLAVTILSSFDQVDVRLIYNTEFKTQLALLAFLAGTSGVDGLICSPGDLTVLKSLLPDDILSRLIKVTPGVRPDWSSTNDQKRTATPAQAIRAGADYLVVGRPITSPPPKVGSPVEAAKRILDEIAAAV